MSVEGIFALQIVGSMVLFALIGRWYWAPRVASRSLRDALAPLLVIHLTRTWGLIFLVPTVVDSGLPRGFASPAAYGDLIAAGLALASLVALRTRLRWAPVVVWIFSLEGIGDLVNAFVQGIRIDMLRYELGAGWFIFTVLVPALLVTHLAIVVRLVRHARDPGDILLAEQRSVETG